MDTHSTQTQSATFNLSQLIERAKLVLLSPKECWTKISSEAHEPLTLIKSTIAPLMILNIICALIGTQILTKTLGIYSPELGMSLSQSFIAFTFSQIILGAVSIGMIFLGAFILHKLAPMFQGEVSKERAFIFLGHAIIPSLLGGLLAILPFLGALGVIFSIISLSALYFGAPVMTTVPRDRQLGFVVSFVVAMLLISFFLVLPIAGILL
jgi:hypothetical protein